MKSTTWATLLLLTISSGAIAAGDPAAGKAKAATCTACHGADGNSANPEWPSIAGQHASYIVAQLDAFKAERRVNALMYPVSAGLSQQDMEDLGAYFESQTRRGLFADQAKQELVAQGERIFRGGIRETGVPACMSCHGPDGAGNALAVFPMLTSQHPKYTAMQLKAYRSGERATDPRAMMRDAVKYLTDEEIEALSEFLTGLH